MIQRSWLGQLYAPRLRSWADRLTLETGAIIAISRKGPRLIELLIAEGLLPLDFMKRVVSEKALPFLQDIVGDLLVVDDSVTFGSTFDRTLQLAQIAIERSGGKGHAIGIPFAVSDEILPKYRTSIQSSYLDLKRETAAAFVYDEMLAFHLLGKPLDIDHPILSLSGDFGDPFLVESALEQVACVFGEGLLIPFVRRTPAAERPGEVRSWTIVPGKSRPHSEFSKLRLYLSADSKLLNVVSICPMQLEADKFDALESYFSEPLSNLWHLALEAAWNVEGQFARTSREQSLATWANFLHEAETLYETRTTLQSEFAACGINTSWLGPQEDDIQLLIGPALASTVSNRLRCVLENGLGREGKKDLLDHLPSYALTERVPTHYEEGYKNLRSELLQSAQDVSDVVEAVFYAQHRAIDLASRDERENSQERLDFGVSFGELKRIVASIIPDAGDYDIHWSIDSLIDRGAIVPKHIELSESGRRIWARGFRVGEGSVPTLLHTVRLLFDALSSSLQSEDLSAITLEKFFVLALADASDDRRLEPLQYLGIKKGFHLYGARPMIVTGTSRQFLVEWAVNHSILRRASRGDSMYEAPPELDLLFPKSERPWDREVREGLEDLAEIVAVIQRTEGLKTSALIALTSAATEEELHRALQAELGLWLDHDRCSVYDALAVTARLAALPQPPERAELHRVASVLADLSNFIAQANEKMRLYEGRDGIYSRIEAVVQGEKTRERAWMKLRDRLKGREVAEARSAGISEIKSALRVAYQTNRLLRDLVALAGHRDPQRRDLPIAESLGRLLDLLNDATKVDHAARAFFRSRGDEQPDVALMIQSALDDLPGDFSGSFQLIRSIVLEVAGRCAEILREFSTEELREASIILEPPKFIVMWDVRGSTERESRDELEALIGRANRRVAGMLRRRLQDFRPESKDDGNGAICEAFSDALAIFRVLSEVYEGQPFRAGCEVNLQGRLNYYPESKALGGRAYEYAARTMSLFKELSSTPERWKGGELPLEPRGSYLVIGELAKRFAEEEGAWPPSGLAVHELDGFYKPRVSASLPIKMYLVL